MFPKPKNQYICINDLENDQIRSFWPHFQVEHFVHGMDMLRRVYGTLLYGSLCSGIFSELLELGHAVERLDFRPERLDLRPEKLRRGDVRTDVHNF